MIYIKTNSMSPYFNFALEEYLITEKEMEDKEIFLFWRTKPTVMVGKFQNTLEEINKEYIDENKVMVVRRNSGGGAIYTDEGAWQFTFITKDYEGEEDTFKAFTTPVIKALRKMNLDVQFNSRNDLSLAGKKISGNAQFKKNDALLHHGSILVNSELENLVRSLNVSEEKIISKSIKSVRERVTNIADHLENEMTMEDFRDRLVADILEDNYKEYILTEEDLAKIKKIEETKFLTWEWNYGKSPEFNISKGKRFTGGELKVYLDVANGKIKSCKFNGDFFYKAEISDLENKFINIHYEKNKLRDFINENNLANYFHDINNEELLSVMIS